MVFSKCNCGASSEIVSSSIPSWQILTAHAQPFRWARVLVFCLKVPLHSLLVWASSGGSGETARMRRLAWTFAARIGDKYQIRLTRPNYITRFHIFLELFHLLTRWYSYTYESQHDKTNKMASAPSEDFDQPGRPPSLIRVFAVRMNKAWALSHSLSAQRRLWSDLTNAQAGLSLRSAHTLSCCGSYFRLW